MSTSCGVLEIMESKENMDLKLHEYIMGVLELMESKENVFYLS